MLTMLTRTVATKLKARRMGDESGQGTTEYAILVGVLVVIAILAIGLFRGNLEDLWGAMSEGINGLTVPQ